MQKSKEIIERLNSLGKQNQPFVFIVDFEGNEPLLFHPDNSNDILWKTPTHSNNTNIKFNQNKIDWESFPVSLDEYKIGFQLIQDHINNGDSYLLNYTKPTRVNTNLSLKDIFQISSASYKVLLKDRFVCFSPEIFVKINDGKISSFPMKGTIDASVKNAKELILNDLKELAEHNTIVDLIRNDLSIVAENVTVEKFRYLERIKTNQRDLWQVSSKISGDLPNNYESQIGNIIYNMLPAGSISGAPKKKTLEIIEKAENYTRGFYTGIFCHFDGKNLDSCVLIRYIEKQDEQFIYKSGGGITFLSDAKKEYEEMLKKVYVPIA